MPELPEVEVVVRALRAPLTGFEITGVVDGHPDVYAEAPRPGAAWPRTVLSVGRRGKLILLELEGDLRLVVHLRMTGRLSVVDAGAELEPHTHVRFSLEGGRELRFVDPRRFGRVRLETGASLAESRYFARLGPEPLELSGDDLRERLGGSRARIKAVLLDQSKVAGIGNIYADEILFDCGLHPAQPAATLLGGEWVALAASMRRILGSAIERGGSTIRDYRSADGRSGSYQEAHLVFGRSGEACADCGRRIRKIRVAGRGTHFCPGCQRLRRRQFRSRLRRGTTSR